MGVPLASGSRFHTLGSRGIALGMLVALGSGACGGVSEKASSGLKLSADCHLDSECDAELTCTFRRCHEPCGKDADCPVAERCVKGEGSTDGAVCQLPDETRCDENNACEGAQVCGVDAECRDECTGATDCVVGQVCAKSRECASADRAKDLLDGNGNIVPSN